VMVPTQADVAKFLESFKEFPPRQKPGSFSIDQVMESMQGRSQGRSELTPFGREFPSGHPTNPKRMPAFGTKRTSIVDAEHVRFRGQSGHL